MESMAAVMEFRLLSEAPLSFKKNREAGPITKIAHASAEKLEKVRGCSTKFLGQLESLLTQPSPGIKRRRLSNPIHSKLLVQVRYIPAQTIEMNKAAYFSITDDDTDEDDEDDNSDDENDTTKPYGNGLLARLVRICGGFENVKVDLKLKFGTSGDTFKLTRKDKALNDESIDTCSLFGRFDFTESLKEKWETHWKFTGNLTLTVKLNQEAVNQILGRSHALNFGAVSGKLLEQAEVFGDAVILLENGVSVRCHKGILAAQSDVFQAMFTSGMKETSSSTVEMRDVSEGGVRALLAYLYCGDIKEPLRCSLTATELLTIADKYGIAELFETMKELVLDKEDEWFSVAAALNLLSLGKNRAEDGVFKEIEAKAKTVLGTKSRDEFKQCTEFQEMLSNPDTAFEVCTYFIQSK